MIDKLKVDMWMIVRPTVTTTALIPVDGYQYESAQGWPDLIDSKSKEQG